MKNFVKLAVLLSLAATLTAEAQGRHGAKTQPTTPEVEAENEESATDTQSVAPNSSRKNLGMFSDGPMTSNGFTVSIVKSAMKAKTKVEFMGLTETNESSADQEFGVAVGYDYVKLGNLGAKGALNYNTYEGEGDPATLRADASLTYGANEYVYFFGGLNIQSLLGDGSKNFETGVGVQATR